MTEMEQAFEWLNGNDPAGVANVVWLLLRRQQLEIKICRQQIECIQQRIKDL